jgi:hypothetical protein
LHLVIGSDLDDQELERARAHLAQCAPCSEAARQARRTRQLYFEQALKESAEPLNLWQRLAPQVAEAGLLRPSAKATPKDTLPEPHTGAALEGLAGPEPAKGSESEPVLAQDPLSALAAVPAPSARSNQEEGGAKVLPGPGFATPAAQGPGSARLNPAAQGSRTGAAAPRLLWRRAVGGLLGGGLAAAALIAIFNNQTPSPLGSPESGNSSRSGALTAASTDAPVVASANDARRVGAPASGAAPADPNAPSDASPGGLRSIPASERFSANPQGFEYFRQQQIGQPLAPSGRESLVNWSYPR